MCFRLLVNSTSRHWPSEGSTPLCALGRNWGISKVFEAFLDQQLTADSLLHPAHCWPWEELTGLGGNPWGLCKYKGLISASCYLSSSGLGGGFHLSTCSLIAQIILAAIDKNIITVIYPTSFALQALKCMGEVVSILGRQL